MYIYETPIVLVYFLTVLWLQLKGLRKTEFYVCASLEQAKGN